MTTWTKKQFIVWSGQILLSKIDARNGAFGIVPPELGGAIITGNFWTYDINKELDMDKNYLNYLMIFKENQSFIGWQVVYTVQLYQMEKV